MGRRTTRSNRPALASALSTQLSASVFPSSTGLESGQIVIPTEDFSPGSCHPERGLQSESRACAELALSCEGDLETVPRSESCCQIPPSQILNLDKRQREETIVNITL